MNEMLLKMIQSPEVAAALGITLVGLFGIIITKILTAKPEWEKYMGVVITAIKFVEKTIPDDTPNIGVRRFDECLKYVVHALEARGVKVSYALKSQIALNIPVVHDMLESNGTL